VKPVAQESDLCFDALTVVSPLACGGEDKDQDRARWFASAQVASVCDGVTSSPRCEEAAELVTNFAPMLFNGDRRERLGAVCELLIAHRLDAKRDPVVLPHRTPKAMQNMLAEVAQERMGSAFQTTLVAASFTKVEAGIKAEVIRCGDSAFFAFSPAGELLAASPSWGQAPTTVGAEAPCLVKGIRFGPGDELLVKVLGKASEPAFQDDVSQILAKHRPRWLVCTPLDRCTEGAATNQQGSELPTLWLTDHDLLLVPEFLIGRAADKKADEYRRILYSSSIHLASNSASATSAISFSGKGSVTDVLPDHYLTGRWINRQEHFPLDAQFVLASDGFYGAFASPQPLWTWLLENKAALLDQEKRKDLMQQLHECLHSRSGDDDMSFVWVSPRVQVGRQGVRSTDEATQETRSRCRTKSSFPG
jgi:hypothetical protein